VARRKYEAVSSLEKRLLVELLAQGLKRSPFHLCSDSELSALKKDFEVKVVRRN
jgi:hypothetical protein